MEAQSDGSTRVSCPFADVRPEGCICIALADNKRISIDYQSRYCFTEQHVRCRRFQRAVPEIPEPEASKIPAWVDDPRLVAAVAAISVILFLAIVATAFHGTWSGWFAGGGATTPTAQAAVKPTPSPTVIVLGGSSQGSAGAGTPSATGTQAPVLQVSPTSVGTTPAATASTTPVTPPVTLPVTTPTSGTATSTPASTEGTATSTPASTGGPTTSTTSPTQPTASTPNPTYPSGPPPQTSYPVNASFAATPSVHTVLPGETLFSIGQAYGIPDVLIAAANNLTDVDLIMPGDLLFIPSPDGHLPPEAPLAGVHIVAPGDAMSTIAAEFGVSVQTLMTFNNIADADLIHVGTIIKIPSTASASSSTALTTDVVQTGDTLYSISQRFGVSVSAIMTANSLSDPSSLRAGQVLTIPGV